MQEKTARRLLKELPEGTDVAGKLVIDALPIVTKVGRKHSAKSYHRYRFALLNISLSKDNEKYVLSALSAELADVSYEAAITKGNEVYVTFLGVDYPLVDELDIHVAAAIGFATGFPPEDVLLRITDGAGVGRTKHAKYGVKGARELVLVGDVYEVLLSDETFREEALENAA